MAVKRQCSVGALQIRDNNFPLQRPATRPPTAGKKRKKKKEEEERKKKKKEEDTFWAGSCSSNNDTKTLDKNAIHKRYGLVKDTAKVILAPMPTKETERELEAARVFVKKNPTDEDEDDDKDPLMAAEYVDEIFEHMHSLEDDLEGQERMKPNQTYIDCSWRRTLMDWLVAVHNEFILPPETLFLTVNWFNRFLSCTEVRINKLQLVGATALFIAAKYEGGTFLSVKDIVKITAHSYTANDVIKAELSMLNKLNFSLGWPGPLSFLRRISRADGYHLKTRTLSKYFLDVTVMDERFVDCVPSFLAAGSYCLARLMLKKGDWSLAHVHYSGYTLAQLQQLLSVILECCKKPQEHHEAVYEKYKGKKYNKISTFVGAEVQNGFSLITDLTDERPTCVKISLEMLPNELLLAIVRNVPNVWDFALTNKFLFGIGADILVEQAKTSNSFSEACRAIWCMSMWIEPDCLTSKFLTRVCTQVIKDIKHSRFRHAKSTLKFIERLPSNTRVPDDCFSDVVETGRDFIIREFQAISKYLFNNAQRTLEVIQLLPSNTLVSDDYFLGVVAICRNFIIQSINNNRFCRAIATVKVIEQLQSNTCIPDNFFLKVVTTGLVVIIQAINNKYFDRAKSALGVIHRLPSNTRVSNDYFINVVETVRHSVIEAMDNNQFDDAKPALDVMEQLSIMMSARILPLNAIPDLAGGAS